MQNFTAYKNCVSNSNIIGTGEYKSFYDAAYGICGYDPKLASLHYDYDRSSETRKFIQFATTVDFFSKSLSQTFIIDMN